jgi:PHD/YefM family antitoxin component YafN of YafNO toxin-antitoxin module
LRRAGGEIAVKSMSLTEARNSLLKLADEIGRNPSTVIEVRKRGKRVITLMSADLYEALVETLEVLSNEKAASKLRQSMKEIDAGQGIPWAKAKKRLGLAK